MNEYEFNKKVLDDMKARKMTMVADLIASIYRTGYDQGFHEANKENFDTFIEGWLERFKELVF